MSKHFFGTFTLKVRYENNDQFVVFINIPFCISYPVDKTNSTDCKIALVIINVPFLCLKHQYLLISATENCVRHCHLFCMHIFCACNGKTNVMLVELQQ